MEDPHAAAGGQAPAPEQPSGSPAANASNWLRLVFHAAICSPGAGGEPCVLPQCANARALLVHTVDCEAGTACFVGACNPLRQLLLHYLTCQEPACAVCAAVYADLEDRAALPPGAAAARGDDDGSPQPGKLDGGGGGMPNPDPQGRADQQQQWMSQQAGGAASQAGHANYPPGTLVAPGSMHARRAAAMVYAVQYLQYLLHCLMSKAAVAAASPPSGSSQVPGRQLWLALLGHQQQQQAEGGGGDAPPRGGPDSRDGRQQLQGQLQDGSSGGGGHGGGGGQAGAAAGGGAGGAGGAAAGGRTTARQAVGRRLVLHRFTCQAPRCEVCGPACALFRRPRSLQQQQQALGAPGSGLAGPEADNDDGAVVEDLGALLASLSI